RLDRWRGHLGSVDGVTPFGGVLVRMCPRLVPADPENRIPMSLHCPLAVDGKDVILVDTGLGERLSERELATYKVDPRGGLSARLEEIGLTPEDVTHVILTHLHFDHCGGVVAR